MNTPRELNVAVRLTVSEKTALAQRAETNRRSMSSEAAMILGRVLLTSGENATK